MSEQKNPKLDKCPLVKVEYDEDYQHDNYYCGFFSSYYKHCKCPIAPYEYTKDYAKCPLFNLIERRDGK